MLLLQRLSRPASGALEVLKLAALLAMVVDHANKYALKSAYPVMEHIGRLAFPFFALVVAANLRWNTADPQRYFIRLALWGMASQAIYTWATGRTDLNTLLTLGVGVQLVLAAEALRQHSSVVGVLWLMVVIVATLACDYRLTGPSLVLLFHGLGVAALNTSLLFAPAACVAHRGWCRGMAATTPAAPHPLLVLSVLSDPLRGDSLDCLAEVRLRQPVIRTSSNTPFTPACGRAA